MEKILYAPGCNSTEFVRSLALQNKNNFGLRVLGTKDFAELLLERSGKAIDGVYICAAEAAAMIFKQVKAIPYFESANYKNVVSIIESINEFRMHITSDEKNEFESKLKDSNFKDKNEAVIKVYNLYLDQLKKHNRYDDVMLIRKAISDNTYKSKIYLSTYFDLKPLEEMLYKSATDHAQYLTEFIENKPLKIKDYVKAYGESNEVEYILNYIKKNNIPLDQVTIACINVEKYTKLISDYSHLYKFGITTGSSTSIANTRPGKLLKQFVELANQFYDPDMFIELINNNYFDKEKLVSKLGEMPENLKVDDVILAAAKLRLSFANPKENDNKIEALKSIGEDITLVDKITIIKEEINGGLSYLLSEYTKLNELDKNEEKVLSKITTLLSYANVYDIDIGDLLESANSLLSGCEVCDAGKIHVTSLSSAKSVFRNYLFVIGLSADAFPGSPKEDCVLLDEDYEKIGYKDISIANTNKNKKVLFDLLAINAGCDNEIHLIYSELSQSDLKGHNASSTLFEAYKMAEGNDKTMDQFVGKKDKDPAKVIKPRIIEFGYTDSRLTPNSELVKNYVEIGDENNFESPVIRPEEEISCKCRKYNGYSASALVEFFKCPRSFYYKYVIGIPSEFDKNPLEPIQPNDYGTLCHYILENKSDEDDFAKFLRYSLDEYDKYFIRNVPIAVPDDAKKEMRNDFIEIMTNAFNLRNRAKVAIKEEDFSTMYEDTGVRVHGFPDLVEDLGNNKYRVVDYKVKNRIDHKPEEPKTIIQIMLYSYIFQKRVKGAEVVEAEFQYLKQGKKIKVTNGFTMEEQVEKFDALMREFADALKTSKFTNEVCDSCDYCKYKGFCHPVKKGSK